MSAPSPEHAMAERLEQMIDPDHGDVTLPPDREQLLREAAALLRAVPTREARREVVSMMRSRIDRVDAKRLLRLEDEL